MIPYKNVTIKCYGYLPQYFIPRNSSYCSIVYNINPSSLFSYEGGLSTACIVSLSSLCRYLKTEFFLLISISGSPWPTSLLRPTRRATTTTTTAATTTSIASVSTCQRSTSLMPTRPSIRPTGRCQRHQPFFSFSLVSGKNKLACLEREILAILV